MLLVRGLLLAHVCASALLLLLLWAVVLVQHVAARGRRTTGRRDRLHVPAPRGLARAAPDSAKVAVPDRPRPDDAAEQDPAAARPASSGGPRARGSSWLASPSS